MVVYDTFFGRALDRKFWMNYEKNFIDNYYKTIYGSVRSAYSSSTVHWGKSDFSSRRNFTEKWFTRIN